METSNCTQLKIEERGCDEGEGVHNKNPSIQKKIVPAMDMGHGYGDG
jgi:hypothetical protein